MKASLMAAAASSALMVGSLWAQTPAAPPTPAAPAAAAPAAGQEKLICRSERVTGTRNTKRVCRTAEQAAAEKKAAREFVESGQRKTSAESGAQ